jgi:RNA polymerase sigma-70 factor, ECF subfamily
VDGRERLEQLIEVEREGLFHMLRHYVLRAGLAAGHHAETLAEELLNETVVEALRTAHRLKADVHPKPWLLGIALNLIKRKQVEIAKRERREPLMRDLLPDAEDILSEDELFDRLPIRVDGAADHTEVNREIEEVLAHVSKDDGDLIRLALSHDMNGEALARALNISPGAARVRLHRALNRLRAALAEERANDG